MTPTEGTDHRGDIGSEAASEQTAPLVDPEAPEGPRALNGIGQPHRPPRPKREMGWRRGERIRLSALTGLERRRQIADQAAPGQPLSPTDPESLTFKEPPGLLPPSVRKNLQ